MDHRPQHVRTVEEIGRTINGKAGGATTRISRAGLRTQPSPTRIDHDGRWHNISLRHDGIQAALKRAQEAANGLDVRLGGGVATIQDTFARAS